MCFFFPFCCYCCLLLMTGSCSFPQRQQQRWLPPMTRQYLNVPPHQPPWHQRRPLRRARRVWLFWWPCVCCSCTPVVIWVRMVGMVRCSSRLRYSVVSCEAWVCVKQSVWHLLDRYGVSSAGDERAVRLGPMTTNWVASSWPHTKRRSWGTPLLITISTAFDWIGSIIHSFVTIWNIANGNIQGIYHPLFPPVVI